MYCSICYCICCITLDAFSWTTPVAVRKTESRISCGTPLSIRKVPQSGDHDDEVVRNLFGDLSLDEGTTCPIPDILVKGVSELSVSDANKYFPKNIPKPNDNHYDLHNPQASASSALATSFSTDTKLPIPSSNDLTRLQPAGKNEPRLRHPKSTADLTNISQVDVPTYRVRRYFSTHIIRWGLLFIIVWSVYFIYINITTDMDKSEKRHL